MSVIFWFFGKTITLIATAIAVAAMVGGGIIVYKKWAAMKSGVKIAAVCLVAIIFLPTIFSVAGWAKTQLGKITGPTRMVSKPAPRWSVCWTKPGMSGGNAYEVIPEECRNHPAKTTALPSTIVTYGPTASDRMRLKYQLEPADGSKNPVTNPEELYKLWGKKVKGTWETSEGGSVTCTGTFQFGRNVYETDNRSGTYWISPAYRSDTNVSAPELIGRGGGLLKLLFE